MLLCVGFLSAENQAKGFKSFVAFCHVGGWAGPLGAWVGRWSFRKGRPLVSSKGLYCKGMDLFPLAGNFVCEKCETGRAEGLQRIIEAKERFAASHEKRACPRRTRPKYCGMKKLN